MTGKEVSTNSLSAPMIVNERCRQVTPINDDATWISLLRGPVVRHNQISANILASVCNHSWACTQEGPDHQVSTDKAAFLSGWVHLFTVLRLFPLFISIVRSLLPALVHIVSEYILVGWNVLIDLCNWVSELWTWVCRNTALATK